MFTKLSFILCNLIQYSFGYNLAVVGANGNLGRELVFQAINDRNLEVLGLSSQTNILYQPSRVNSFNPDTKNQLEFKSSKLTLHNYWSYIDKDYDHLIFCTSAKPFQKDYSDQLTQKLLQNLCPQCQSISLVSAFGVGDSLQQGNLGIQIMDSLYLKDVYRAKNQQELLINNFMDQPVQKFIYRPKALSYGDTILNSTPRETLAKEILNNIEILDLEKRVF